MTCRYWKPPWAWTQPRGDRRCFGDNSLDPPHTAQPKYTATRNMYSRPSFIRTTPFPSWIQWSLTDPDPTYTDYSLIRTHVWEPIMIIYRENGSFIQKFSHPDSQIGNRGVRISEGLYIIIFGSQTCVQISE